jgi:hypothetical protein
MEQNVTTRGIFKFMSVVNAKKELEESIHSKECTIIKIATGILFLTSQWVVFVSDDNLPYLFEHSLTVGFNGNLKKGFHICRNKKFPGLSLTEMVQQKKGAVIVVNNDIVVVKLVHKKSLLSYTDWLQIVTTEKVDTWRFKKDGTPDKLVPTNLLYEFALLPKKNDLVSLKYRFPKLFR